MPSIDSQKYQYLIISPLTWYGAAAARYFSYCGFDVAWLKGRFDEAKCTVLVSSSLLETVERQSD